MKYEFPDGKPAFSPEPDKRKHRPHSDLGAIRDGHKIAALVRKIMDARRLTLDAAAKEAGIGAETIRLVMQGKCSTRTLAKLQLWARHLISNKRSSQGGR